MLEELFAKENMGPVEILENIYFHLLCPFVHGNVTTIRPKIHQRIILVEY